MAESAVLSALVGALGAGRLLSSSAKSLAALRSSFIRALTLFAQKKYKEAAAAVYAVLAVGPGWDWDTLKSLYPDVDTYTKQLRALEDYQKQNPKSADASFLLAYQYLTLGKKDAAIKQLQRTVELQPKDQVSAQLIKVLEQPPQETKDRPQPGT